MPDVVTVMIRFYSCGVFDLKDLKDDIFGPVLLAFDLLQDVQELQTD